MYLFVKKRHRMFVTMTKTLRFDCQTLQKCCCIILYKPDGRILKFLSFFTTFDAVFYEQIYDYNPFSFTIPFAV